jgi:pyruvate dehydrogenase E2 component (dihydrolipoamide acetyltransferase)
MEAEESDRIVPLRGMRGMIADKLQKSVLETAQVTHHADCDGSLLVAWKDHLRSEGRAVSIEDLMIFLAAAALREHPDLNGIVRDREIHLKAGVHVSVAIALPGNLLVAPTIFDADRKSPIEIAAARQDLIKRANENKLSVSEMTNGSFTVSNLGRSRVRHFSPILNVPQIAILGIGRLAKSPWVDPDGNLSVRPVMGLSLTFDHRAVDGAPAAAFLSRLCTMIESPS